jgi:predicted SprT family Zn-dependent metalloprotease
MKHPKVTEKKLGREKSAGIAWFEDNLIEIDPRQSSKEYLKTLIHERLHLLFPEWSEKEIARVENQLGNFLWKQSYRKVKL